MATDHIIESFRNTPLARGRPGYKTGEGIEPALFAQFHPLEDALVAMGVATWPMVELRPTMPSRQPRISPGLIDVWTRYPSGRLTRISRSASPAIASCRSDRRSGQIRNEQGVRDRFGVAPAFIPDFLALVGDAADGYPGIPGIGVKTAARLIDRHGYIEEFPADVLRDRHDLALLFKNLATLRVDAPLFEDVDRLRWTGPTEAFASDPQMGNGPAVATRVEHLLRRGRQSA